MRARSLFILPIQIFNRQSLLLLITVTILNHVVLGQSDPISPDTRLYAPTQGSDIDTVSMTNGALEVHIPLWSIKQRGNLDLSFTLRFTSPQYMYSKSCAVPNQPCVFQSAWNGRGVFLSSSTNVGIGQTVYQPVGGQPIPSEYYWSVVTPDGGQHKLVGIGNQLYRSMDASGWLYNQNTSVLTSRDGVTYTMSTAGPVVQDTNGNTITPIANSKGQNAGWTDSLGRSIPELPPGMLIPSDGITGNTDTSGCAGPLPVVGAYLWSPPGYQGNVRFKFCYATVNINVAAPVDTGGTNYGDTETPDLLQSVILPDSSAWVFQYDSMGRLSEITMPTGGTTAYSWGGQRQYCWVNPGGGYPYNTMAQVSTRTLNDGSNSAVWQYGFGAEQVTSNSRTITTSVTDPLNNKAVHTITGLNNSCSYYDTQVQYYDDAGALQRTDTTQYYATADINYYPTAWYLQGMEGVMPQSQTTRWANGATKQVTYQIDPEFIGTNYNSTASATYPYGLVTSKTEYDYGNGNPGAALDTTSTAYLAFTDSTGVSLANNLLDRTSSVTLTDDVTGQQLITNFGYDESSLSPGNASGTGWSSTPRSTKRGNLTSTSRYWDTAGTYLKTTRTYYNTGKLASVTEPSSPEISGSLTTNYQFSATYDGAYLTLATNPKGYSTSYGYDESSGLLTSITDPNNQTTSYGYDEMSRLAEQTHPGGDHNLSTSVTYSYPDPNHVERAEVLDTSIGSETDVTTYDGLGRTVQSHHTDPEGDTYVDTTYDLLSRKYTVSTPYRSKSDLTSYGLTTYSYDLFGRTTEIQNPDDTYSNFQFSGATTLAVDASNGNTKLSKLTRVDALGRLIGVCEVVTGQTPAQQGGDTPANCSTTSSSYPGMEIGGYSGFTTAYIQAMRGTTGITQGAQTRTFVYDSLNQLTDSTNPEVGHIHYTYDNDGNVIAKTSPSPGSPVGSSNTVTANFTWDNLHRMLSRTYADSGSSSVGANTPAVTLNYDQTSVGTISPENPLGRLTSEYTALNGAVQAQTIYSYDTNGKVQSHYQCVLTACSSSAYQDVEYHSDGAENLTKLSTGNGGYTLTYNQAGHLTNVTPVWTPDSNHPAQIMGPISGQTQYAPNGNWSNIALGNGTSEAYSYNARWLMGMSVSGMVQNAPATKSTGLISITGSEESKQVVTSPGTPSTGSVTISGQEGQHITTCSKATEKCYYAPDTGTVTLTVNGCSSAAGYGSGSTATSVAASLASGLSTTCSGVIASHNGAVIALTSAASGTNTNYAFSVSNGGDFAGTTSGPTLTGGTNPSYGTVYDSGTVTATINGNAATVQWSQGSTITSLAQSLASAIQSASGGALVTSVSSGYLTVMTTQGGSTNWPISIATTYDSKDFSSPSFTFTVSGMSGGSNAQDGNGVIYSYSLGHAPNGQIVQSADSANGTWNYTYDDMNRLITAQQLNSSNQVVNGLSWDYDRYGNRWRQNLTAGTGTTPQLTFSLASNHASSNLSYDVAGDVLNDTVHNYTYDAEGRIAQVSGGISYIYDAEGRRVGKSNGTVYVVGLAGQVMDEIDNGTWVRSEISAGGHHFATVTSATVAFMHADWLGTERARSNMAGYACELISSQPFGDNEQKTTPVGASSCDPTPNFFAGKQRDPESNLDDFGARYFGSQWGRWMSPDWSGAPSAVPYATMTNPQSLNLYSYVGNDPIDGQDPDGHASFAGEGWGFSIGMHLPEMGTVDAEDDYAIEPDPGQAKDGTTPASHPGTQPAQPAQQQMTTSAAGLAFIKGWEGWNGTVDKKTGLTFAKDDGFGNGTIGWGHNCGKCADFAGGITKAEGDALLIKDLGSFEGAVNGLGANLSQQQFDGLVSFAFNVRNSGGSTLFSNVASGTPVTEGNFTAYGHARVNGQMVAVPGLMRRRESEYNVYANGVYDSSH